MPFQLLWLSKYLANIMSYLGLDRVVRGISNRRNFGCVLLHYLCVCLQITPGALSRALPTSLDGNSVGELNANSPTLVPEATKEGGVAWSKNMHWFKCITGTPVDDIVELGCTMIPYGSPVHKRSPGIMGSGLPSDGLTADQRAEPQSSVVDLHPCFLENTSGRSILVCETVDQAFDESSVDSRLQALVVGLINGLPISMGPQLTFPHKFDWQMSHVSVYPSGDDYNILMTDILHKTRPLEPLSPASGTPESFMEELPPGLDTDSGRNHINAAPRSIPPEETPRQKLQGLLEGDLLLRCWFQLNEQTGSAELNCAVNLGAGFSLSDFNDIDTEIDLNYRDSDGRDPNVNYPDDIQDLRNIDSTVKHSGNPTKNSDRDESHTYFKRQSRPETLVDRWFLCWIGSGSKILCEIPDWYTGDVYHPQSRHVKKATLQTHGGKACSPLLTSTLPRADLPLHFLVDSPPLWQHCKSVFDSVSYTMQCSGGVTHRDAVQRNRTLKSTDVNQTLHSRSSYPLKHPRDKRARIISNQPSHNTTSLKCGPGRTSAFGKMGETFAFIGFFTVLAVFTIVLSWLVKHLFLAIYDSLEEWTNSRRRKRRLVIEKNFGIRNTLDNRAPSYNSTDRGFQRPVDSVAFPQTAVMNEGAEAVISTTGSQAVDGGSDSIKRKKAAMRATVSEEHEP